MIFHSTLVTWFFKSVRKSVEIVFTGPVAGSVSFRKPPMAVYQAFMGRSSSLNLSIRLHFNFSCEVIADLNSTKYSVTRRGIHHRVTNSSGQAVSSFCFGIFFCDFASRAANSAGQQICDRFFVISKFCRHAEFLNRLRHFGGRAEPVAFPDPRRWTSSLEPVEPVHIRKFYECGTSYQSRQATLTNIAPLRFDIA